VGRLLRDEQARDAVVVVTADHGEGLFEHERYFGHDILLYDTSVRVPLLVGVPGESGGLSTDPARTMDVAPTISGICGLNWPGREGRDLRADPAPAGDDLQFALETYPQQEKAKPLYGLRTETEKVIWIQRERRREYYNLLADPAERTDLAQDPPESLRILGEDLELDLRNRPPERPKTLDDHLGMDDATREALESLGYLDSGS
jgi:arylsulfatase A-like enzyme